MPTLLIRWTWLATASLVAAGMLGCSSSESEDELLEQAALKAPDEPGFFEKMGDWDWDLGLFDDDEAPKSTKRAQGSTKKAKYGEDRGKPARFSADQSKTQAKIDKRRADLAKKKADVPQSDADREWWEWLSWFAWMEPKPTPEDQIKERPPNRVPLVNAKIPD